MKHPEKARPLRSRKRFGQNFLTDQHTIDRIVEAIDSRPDDTLVEIGPGHGELTAQFINAGCHLEVIEIDRDLIAELHRRFPDLHVIEADVLKHDFTPMVEAARADNTALRIVGNLPYNISTPLLFKLFRSLTSIRDMHFMLQLEVVERMVAMASTPNYGRLSVMSQYYCDSTRLFSVPATAFTPMPRVTSAVVRLLPRLQGPRASDPGVLSKMVNEAFSQRRKTIRNALRTFLSGDEILALSLDPKSRPENLTLTDYVNCANFVSARQPDPGQAS